MIRANNLPFLSHQTEFSYEQRARWFSVQADWLYAGDCRLDAPFYAEDVSRAYRAIRQSGFDVRFLGDPEVTERIYNLPRFKRIYTNDSHKGYPYLSASEALLFRPHSERWVARDKVPSGAEWHFAREGWILVTCSGVVGRCRLVTRLLEPYFLTHDLLRIIPVLPAGYVYAYLCSWLGQALMVKGQYGGTITHIEPHHLQGVPIPILPCDAQRAIHERVTRAYQLRDQAVDLLNRADELLHEELGLTRFDSSDDSLSGSVTRPEAFTIRASEFAGRLDASFHIPVAKTAVEHLRKARYPLVRLGDVAAAIVIPPRFKRIYVEPEHGVPFLRPSDIPMFKPFDLKYLSRCTQVLDQLTLRIGDVLVTTDGTVGRIAFVPRQLAGWAGSNNIGRITYCSDYHRNGYLAAFLMSRYGYYQLTREIYGGVVDHLDASHVAAVWVPDAPLEVQQRIGVLVAEAFEKKEEANMLEAEAVAALEQMIAAGSQASRRYVTNLTGLD